MSLNKILSFIIGKPIGKTQPIPQHQLSAHKKATRLNRLMRREALVGGRVFGPVPAGHHREFFFLDSTTWIWSEQWFDEKTGLNQHLNVRYEFQPRGVLKIVNEVPHGYVEGKELQHLVTAMKTYGQKVASEVYGQPAHA